MDKADAVELARILNKYHGRFPNDETARLWGDLCADLSALVADEIPGYDRAMFMQAATGVLNHCPRLNDYERWEYDTNKASR